MPKLPRWFALLVLIALPWPALAWGPQGHRIIGEMAERQLTLAAREQVRQLLAGEPEPTLAGIANWADDLRGSDPDRRRQTARWHYLNFPRGDCTYVPARDCPDGQCVVAAINRNFLLLADRSRANAERNEALKFLVHFVGDIHQPMHAGYADDRGGNKVQLNYRGEGWNLHSVWDSLIVDSRQLDAVAYADILMKQPSLPLDATRHSDRPAVEWAQESCRIVRQPDMYPSTHTLDQSYLLAHRALAERQLRQAGTRLADMINYALKQPAVAK